jgi:hypothetical protein
MCEKKKQTYWNSLYIKNCPVRYQGDCFSVGYSFYFIKQVTILPKFTYKIKNRIITIELNKIETEVNKFTNIEFGPVNKLAQSEDEIVRLMDIEIEVLDNKLSNYEKTIFDTEYIVPDYAQYTFEPNIQSKPLDFKFIVSSCWSLPGYRQPVTIETYSKLSEICELENPNQIIISGDIVYMGPISLTSNLAVQEAYNQLKEFEPTKSIWSEHVIKTGLDDHDLGFNDTFGFNTNIRLYRKKAQENFPLDLMVDNNNYRLGSYNVKNITFIFADDISNKTINPNYNGIGNNKFNSQLGQEQIQIINNLLTNAWDSYGINALVFIVVGKSMFGSIADTFVLCPQERDEIFARIKYLGLRNVIFICGDSHQSDLSEFVIDKVSGQKIREIRNSAIGSKPRNDPNDNPYQIPGSFIGGKNVFGLVKLNEVDRDIYNLRYEVYDKSGQIYSTEWRTDY